MRTTKKVIADLAQKIGITVGKIDSQTVQAATNEAFKGMDLFREAAARRVNVPFEQAKGNLFEYIEAAKFNRNAANMGNKQRAIVTDADGRPHDPVDIEIIKGNRVVRQVQAKFSNSKHAAADSVNMQRSDKYHSMQRLIRKDDHYLDESSGQKTTLLKRAKYLAETRASKEGTIYQKQYRDVADNLTDELHNDGVSSDGTTLEEVEAAYDNPFKYADSFEKKQIVTEMACTAKNMAAASMVTTGIVSGIKNLFAVFRDEKKLTEALQSIGVEVIESGTKSAVTGVASVAIRSSGIKAGNAFLGDSLASTVLAGGIIDGGVALYSYARGDISAERLRDELVDTTAKAATTIYYTKAVTAMLGRTVSPFVPMAVYTTASYVIACAREIIRNAKLAEEEYNRLTAIIEESAKTIYDKRLQFERYIQQCEESQRRILDSFISSFEYNIETGDNYDEAVSVIVDFANKVGFYLRDVNFDDFAEKMRHKEPLILG